jgi:hypothetical protein
VRVKELGGTRDAASLDFLPITDIMVAVLMENPFLIPNASEKAVGKRPQDNAQSIYTAAVVRLPPLLLPSASFWQARRGNAVFLLSNDRYSFTRNGQAFGKYS